MFYLLLFIGCNLKSENKITDLSSKNSIFADTSVSKKYQPIIHLLDSIFESNSRFRRLPTVVSANYSEFIKKNNEVRKSDSINDKRINFILDTYGWLSWQEIGLKYHLAITNTLQHASLATQEKYLPMVEEAVKNKKAAKVTLLGLKDRIGFRKNGKQLYGTQVLYSTENKKHYLLPIYKPEELLKRWEELGLTEQTLNNTLLPLGLKWDIKEYNNTLPFVLKLLEENHNKKS